MDIRILNIDDLFADEIADSIYQASQKDLEKMFKEVNLKDCKRSEKETLPRNFTKDEISINATVDFRKEKYNLVLQTVKNIVRIKIHNFSSNKDYTAEAFCSPEDTFDINTGLDIAYSKLIDNIINEFCKDEDNGESNKNIKYKI